MYIIELKIFLAILKIYNNHTIARQKVRNGSLRSQNDARPLAISGKLYNLPLSVPYDIFLQWPMSSTLWSTGLSRSSPTETDVTASAYYKLCMLVYVLLPNKS